MQLLGQDDEKRHEADIRALDAAAEAKEKESNSVPKPEPQEASEFLFEGLEDFNIDEGGDIVSKIAVQLEEILQNVVAEHNPSAHPELGGFTLVMVSADGNTRVDVNKSDHGVNIECRFFSNYTEGK